MTPFFALIWMTPLSFDSAMTPHTLPDSSCTSIFAGVMNMTSPPSSPSTSFITSRWAYAP